MRPSGRITGTAAKRGGSTVRASSARVALCALFESRRALHVLHARAARGVLVGELRDVLLVGVPSVSTLFYKGCPGIKTERNAQR